MFDNFVRDIMLSMGTSEDGVRKMWDSPNDAEDGKTKDKTSGRLHKALAHAGEDYYRQQLQPGELLDELWPRIQDLIDKSMQWNDISGGFSKIDHTKEVSILKWCREVLLTSVTTAIFGEKLLQIEPKLLDFFVTFDDDSWKLTYKLPRSMAKDMYVARDNIRATLMKYFAAPQKERAGATWLVHTLEKEMRNIELEEGDIASLFAMPLWV